MRIYHPTTWAFLLTVMLSAGAVSLRAAGADAISSLQGQVHSAKEGPMEGVLVSAKKEGSTITISVVSDEHGHYAFPANRLEPGTYALSIRAVGYDLDGSGSVEVSPENAEADLQLVPSKNLGAQLTNAEWMNSIPGAPADKSQLLNCVDCHTLNRPIESAHSADEFVQVLSRMAGYAYNSEPSFPQRFQEIPVFDPQKRFRQMANYLSTINLSAGPTRPYPLKPLPRIKGKGTRVIITEYDLPRAISQPHDVILDSRGAVWYTDFGQQFIGRLDRKTGAVKEFPLPVIKPPAPIGQLDIENGQDGYLWIGMHYQGALGHFDTKTEQLHVYPLPTELQVPNIQTSMVAPMHETVDGKVWTSYSAKAVARLDTKTGKYQTISFWRRGARRSSADVCGQGERPKACVCRGRRAQKRTGAARVVWPDNGFT